MLFLVLGIDEDGDRTVINQFNLHIGAKDTCGDRSAEALLHGLDKLLVERHGNVAPGGTDVGGAVALGGEGMESELRNDAYLAADVHHRAVHHASLIVEDAQCQQFVGHPVDVFLGVGCLKANEHKQTLSDLAAQFTFDSY